MNDEPFLTPKTRAKLESQPEKGTRHHEAKEIALDMIGNRFTPDQVFSALRGRYSADVTDSELAGIIEWVVGKNPQPSTSRTLHHSQVPLRNSVRTVFSTSEPPTRCVDPISETKRLLRTPLASERGILKRSEPLPEWNEHFSHLLCCCYEFKERVNIVTKYGMREGKAQPSGLGSTLSIEEWVERGVSGSEAGGWMRMNPVSDGVADENVTAYRFVLLENDILPPDLQLNLLVRLPLPISAILWSGGVSYHAWVRVDCLNIESYRAISSSLLKSLQRFGFDQANKNPSRLSRLPGVQRTIGAQSDGRQRLVYLNSKPTKEPILC